MLRTRQFCWLCSIAAAICLACCIQAQAGMILFASRGESWDPFLLDDANRIEGPGLCVPEEVAMGLYLGDHGYSFRMLPEWFFNGFIAETASFLEFADTLDPYEYIPEEGSPFAYDLVIIGGAGASTTAPPTMMQPTETNFYITGQPPLYGIPVMAGEHVILGNRPHGTSKPGSLFMYQGQSSGEENAKTYQYMKIVDPEHPITKGIPTDADGLVKIWRDQPPEWDAHVPEGGKSNYVALWCCQLRSEAAPGTQVLGVVGGVEQKSCFAVVDAGGVLADGLIANTRKVHLFMNGGGSGDARRTFSATTDIAKVLFLRAAQWAMGETLTPYAGEEDFGIVDITPAGAQALNLSWEGSASRTYSIQASLDAATWSNAVRDIAGKDGTIMRVLDVSASPKSLFLRVAAE